MRNNFTHLLILMLVFLSAEIYSQDTSSHKVLTLKEIISAIDKNPSLLAFDERIKSYGAYSQSALSLGAPKITTGLWMFPYSNISKDASQSNGGSFMIGAEQMVMNPTKRKAEQKYMAGMSSVEETMKSFQKQDMIEEAKNVYYEWMILERKLKTLKESEELLKLMIKSGEIGYTYNQNLLSRIYKAKSELYNIQNMQLINENEIRQMNIELNTLMNADKNLTYKIDTTYSLQNYETMPIDTSSIRTSRSDIKNIEESILLFNLKKNLELSKRRPDFGVQYAHMNGFNGMPNQFNLMGMITIPIVPWVSKGYKANLAGIRYETTSLHLRKQAIVNETTGRLLKLQTDIASKKKRVEMYQKNIIPALEKNFNSSLISFEHMKEDMFMTIDAWVALNMAKIESLDLLGQLLKLQTAYERQIEK